MSWAAGAYERGGWRGPRAVSVDLRATGGGWSDPQRAWVLGDERFVGFEFESRSAEEYAKR